MLTAATAAAAAAIVVLLNHQHVATAFYLPGVKPHDYRRGEVYVIPMVGCWLLLLIRIGSERTKSLFLW
jgi:hypothetical protein